MADAQIIPFPVLKVSKSCSDCNWSAFGVYGTWCTLFKEPIVNEDVAEECSEYDN